MADVRDEALAEEGSSLKVVMIASVAAVGGFLFGFDTAVINGAVGALQTTFQASDAAIGLSVSSALIGSAIGAFLGGQLADRLGRIRTMVVASVLFSVSAVGSGLAFGLVDFSLWRAVGGVAVGIASVIAPAYIAEIAPAHLRGRLGSLQQLAIVSGIFAALLVDYGIAAGAGGSAENPFWLGLAAWRWMLLSELPPAILYGIGALMIPESPRYLVAKHRDDKAREVLRSIIGRRAEAKVEEIRQSLSSEHTGRFSDLKGSFGLLPIVWVGIGLSVFQQFVGINVIFYYSSVLWQAVGFSERDSLAITVITSVTNILTTFIAIATVDRFGRRPLLIVGSVGMALTLGAMAYLFGTAGMDATGKPVLEGTSGTIALVAANLYVFCFGLSWGPVVWVLLGEMFNNRIRGRALALAGSAQWVANFLVSATFPSLRTAGLGLAYGLYTAAAMASLVFVLLFIRETKGKELEDME
ncbi:sugar porter (SP) family MFS transporter [Archangium gephyra]|uniref:Glucose/mannose H+ symporter GlcP n=1 Tax=Archangium gephyra TaxID=48 RepID=A0AAC8Q7B7_9BACT|nr:sugar porter family MFS transporter [Archangium gephyra]AKJ02330.1 Glucose/mannose H+ symporter GlcP [Archangium gephyra]REG28740.1 sugar porter (SP) family MFS transporter [Archangium gephyra]